MSHGQPPHVQSIVPCECGSLEPYWHGPEDASYEPGIDIPDDRAERLVRWLGL